MNGVFANNRQLPPKLAGVMTLFPGLPMLFYGIYMLLDHESDGGFFIAIGAVVSIVGIIALLYNYDAYFRVKGTHISARFAWNKRLECELSDILSVESCVDLGNLQLSRLVIVLRNGKYYTVRYLDNTVELADYIAASVPHTFSDKDNIIRIGMNFEKTKRRWNGGDS